MDIWLDKSEDNVDSTQSEDDNGSFDNLEETKYNANSMKSEDDIGSFDNLEEAKDNTKYIYIYSFMLILFILVCSLYFLFGIVCTFLGYRCFKMIMFLYGFIFGSIVVYLICAEENLLPGILEFNR